MIVILMVLCRWSFPIRSVADQAGGYRNRVNVRSKIARRPALPARARDRVLFSVFCQSISSARAESVFDRDRDLCKPGFGGLGALLE